MDDFTHPTTAFLPPYTNFSFDGVTKEPPRTLRDARVLLVDDSKNMRSLLRGVLSASAPLAIREAVDGADALKILRLYDADLILTDNYMAPLDGVEFVRLLRNSRDSPNPIVPVIMVSAYTSRHNVETARDAGIHEFVAKPVSARALLTRINDVLTNPRPYIKTATYFGPDRRRHPTRQGRRPERRMTLPTYLSPYGLPLLQEEGV